MKRATSSPPCRGVLPALLSVLAAALLIFLPGCGGNGDGGSEPPPSTGNVVLFAPKVSLTAVTGEADFSASVLLDTMDTRILVVDAVSESIVILDRSGFASLFTDQADLLALTGLDSIVLGPMDQITEGSLAANILSADEKSGNMIRLTIDGSPNLFSSAAQITSITGQATFQMSLPRELTNSQYVAQDIVTRQVLKFDIAGNAFPFVSGGLLANAAGVPLSEAVVAGWAHGPVSRALFARFASTATIVQILTSGNLFRYVDETDLQTLLPDITDLTVLDMEADTTTDTLLLLIGDGDRGTTLVLVSDVGAALSVFASQDALEAVAGDTLDLSDIIVRPTGAAVAIDEGGAQVIGFSAGVPVIIGPRNEIEDATGAVDPVISMGVPLGSDGVVIPEETSESLILVY